MQEYENLALLPDVENERLHKRALRLLRKRKSRFIIGLGLLLLVVVIWVASSALIQHIFANFTVSPFFLSYFNTGLFSVYLLGFPLGCWRNTRADMATRTPARGDAYVSVFEGVGPVNKGATSRSSLDDVLDLEEEEEHVPNSLNEQPVVAATDAVVSDENPLTTKEVMKLAAAFAPIWFAANFTFNWSLELTSLASNTVLTACSGLFTLILGVVFRIEKFTLMKLLAILITVGGVALISFIDENDTTKNESLVGDLLCLLSAFLFGCYVIFLKVKIGDESRLSMPMFFGFVGLFNIIFLMPLFPILHYTKLEEFHWPAAEGFGLLMLNGVVGTVISDLIWVYGMLLTTPVVATLAVALTIPLSMIVQLVLTTMKFKALYIVGVALVFGGFIWTALLENSAWKTFCAPRDGEDPRPHQSDTEEASSRAQMKSDDASRTIGNSSTRRRTSPQPD